MNAMASGVHGSWRTGALALATALATMLTACAPTVQRAGIPTAWHPSPNFDDRRPNFIVIHYTGSADAAGALATLTNPLRAVSAHYLIVRDGRILQLVDERARAWHAGDSGWGGATDLNSSSIGIELDNDGRSPFPDPQIDALLSLLRDLVDRLRIPPEHVIGHADVAPRRKIDPGPLFPWKRLADAGFGVWCDAPSEVAPDGFDALAALRLVGYDLTDPDAAVRAFKAHFLPDAVDAGLDEGTRRVIACLAAQALGR